MTIALAQKPLPPQTNVWQNKSKQEFGGNLYSEYNGLKLVNR